MKFMGISYKKVYPVAANKYSERSCLLRVQFIQKIASLLDQNAEFLFF